MSVYEPNKLETYKGLVAYTLPLCRLGVSIYQIWYPPPSHRQAGGGYCSQRGPANMLVRVDAC